MVESLPADTTTFPRALGAEALIDPDALIERLHELQSQRGYLSSEALHQVARQLRLPLSQVFGVASFYHLFLLQQPTPHRCGVCLGSACFVRGAMPLARQLAARLGVGLDDPAGNGLWSLQRLGCLGACGQAPVLVVDGALLTRLPLQPAAAKQLEQRLRAAGLPAEPGAVSQTTLAPAPAGPAIPVAMPSPGTAAPSWRGDAAASLAAAPEAAAAAAHPGGATTAGAVPEAPPAAAAVPSAPLSGAGAAAIPAASEPGEACP